MAQIGAVFFFAPPVKFYILRVLYILKMLLWCLYKRHFFHRSLIVIKMQQNTYI